MAIIAKKLVADDLIPKQMANNVVSSVNNVFPDPDTGNVDLTGTVPSMVPGTSELTYTDLTSDTMGRNGLIVKGTVAINITGSCNRINLYNANLYKYGDRANYVFINDAAHNHKELRFSYFNLGFLALTGIRTEGIQILYPCNGTVRFFTLTILSPTNTPSAPFYLTSLTTSIHVESITFEETTFARELIRIRYGGKIYFTQGMPFTAQAGVKYINFASPCDNSASVSIPSWTGFTADNVAGNGTVYIGGKQITPAIQG
jgi:hypothetical protein